MSIMIEVQDGPVTDEAVVVEIVEDVNDAAEHAIGLGCGDDNPYR
ncbi:hypothetical protein [Actinomadura formosensis]|nr:hypothetical protein [Actinomadura formosensis]